MPRTTCFFVNQRVRCNGHEGQIVRLFITGPLKGMAEVSLPGGIACVSLAYVQPIEVRQGA